MAAYILKKTAVCLATLFCVLVFIFVAARLTGNPFEVMYPEGLEPDFEVEDWDNGFMPFGATEPAVAVALQQITGQTPETAVATRAQGMKIKRISSPLAKPLHPEGMIVPARTEE